MIKHYRLAAARAMCIPAWDGLGKLKQDVDTLILGDSVARVNLSSGQWHDLGLGDVINLGNSSVGGVGSDVKMLRYHLKNFKPPARVVMVRHLGAYLDDAITGALVGALEPIACFHLQYNGKWPRVPVVNDYGPVGLPADSELVKQFVKMRPKWLVGPWKITPDNRAALQSLADICRAYRIQFKVAMGPTCKLVEKESNAMSQGWIEECEKAGIYYIYSGRIYSLEEMQDPNHLSPVKALEWSKELAQVVK